VGTAPCFIVEIGEASIISLPGVPREMEFILHQAVIPWLSEKYFLKSQIIKATVLHVASMGESVIDEQIEDLEHLANPTVGLLAHPGQVDIRVTVKASSEAQALALSQPIVEEIKSRLGNNIYGMNQESLESVISKILNQHNLSLHLAEFGMLTTLAERLRLSQPDQINAKLFEEVPENETELLDLLSDHSSGSTSDIAFGVALQITDSVRAYFAYRDKDQQVVKTRQYGGPKEYARLWAENTGLDFLRRQLNRRIGMTEKELYETG
jgi:hypothetical protein